MTSKSPLQLWRDKLEFLRSKRAIESSAIVQFQLDREIEKCLEQIRELETSEIDTQDNSIRDMAQPDQLDVFLCHNSQDKPEVIEIANRLNAKGIKPWLDRWELRPGLSWQELLEEQIEHITTAAVFVGSSGIGPWQQRELRAFLDEFVRRDCPVIPVLLPDAPQKPELPIFLRAMTWVDFRQSDPDPLSQLIWGITGVKPEKNSNTIPLFSVVPSDGSNSNEVELKSERGIDYTKLRDFLKQQKWKEADEETGRVMCEVAGVEEELAWLDEESINNFACEDLCTIDRLWKYYSNEKFGFSIQKEIHDRLIAMQEDDRYIWGNFCDQVVWRRGKKWLSGSELTFSLTVAPRGHFSSFFGNPFDTLNMNAFAYFFYCLMHKVENCDSFCKF